MAEEFQAAVYSGSWWMSPRTTCYYPSCSSDTADMENILGPFWSKDLMDKKSKSSDESSDDSMVFQDIQKPGGRTTTMSPDSAFGTMATVFSDMVETATNDWNQSLLSRVQEEMNTFFTNDDHGLKAEIEAEHQVLTVDEQQSLSFATNSISSTSYSYPSSLVQSLLTSSSPPQQPLYDFHLTNNTPFLSASASPFDYNISSFFPSLSTQFLSKSYKEKEGFSNLRIEHNHDQEIPDLGLSTKKGPEEFPFKRQRLETPSPLPTFKVRKEKLGDRITALQQLVSPFGKTDTASVLHEAIEYIKLLHDQVNILRAPYVKGATKQLQRIHEKVKDDQEHKQDLRSLGLCLVPVSSMFPVATEMTTSFLTPSYEGSFK